MARDTKSGGGTFDIDGLRQVMELMDKHDVSELKIQDGDAKYVFRRGPQLVAGAAPVSLPAPMMAAPAPTAPSAPATGGDAPAAPSTPSNLVEIKSPTVGTFYQAPTPDDPAFVKVGDAVGPATIVCIVEAMKVFNQIPAEVSGKIAKVLLKDGDPVEFGQPLFLVDPS